MNYVDEKLFCKKIIHNFFFKQKTAYEFSACLVGSEMCIRDRSMQTAIAAMPFRSAKKYGGVSFHEDETYLLGAPEILLAACPEKDRFLPQAEEWSAKGCRVLLLAL